MSQFTARGQPVSRWSLFAIQAASWHRLGPQGTEWTLSERGKWKEALILGPWRPCLLWHVARLPKLCPGQGQPFGSHCTCWFPGPADSVSPAAVARASPCCPTFVRKAKFHFQRALVEGRRVWSQDHRAVSCQRSDLPRLLSCPLQAGVHLSVGPLEESRKAPLLFH